MKILVTGATGFTGSYVVPLLLQEKHELACFVRKESNLQALPKGAIKVCYGDLADRASLVEALHGMDALVNIASLGFGHADNMVDAAVAVGVSRAIFISTTAIFTQLNAGSKVIRLAAEEKIMGSRLPYTILRPTMIYGSQRDRNMCRLINYLKRWPVIPILGDGQSLQQPIYVEDVAKAVAQTLMTEKTIGKAYNIAGMAPLTYTQVIDTICQLMKRNVYKLYIPYKLIIKPLSQVERLKITLPIKTEQILRLNENKAFDFAEAAYDFGYQPRTFAQGISLELANMSHR